MSDLEQIEVALRRTARRRRWLRAWKGFGLGAFIGALGWCLALVVYKLLPIPVEVIVTAGWLAFALPWITALIFGLRRVSLLEMARYVDERHRLKERLSTAYEMSRQQEERGGHWRSLVVSDAARHVREVQPRQLLPFRFPLLTRWALLILVLGVGLGFVPEYRTEAFRQREAEARQIREVGKSLAETTRQNLQRRPPVMETTRESVEELADLGDYLSRAKLTRAEAMRELSSRAESLQKEMASLGDKPPVRPLERQARDGTPAPSSRSEMQRQMDALQKAMGNSAANPEKLEDLNQKLRELQRRAARLPSKDSAEGQAAREQLAQEMAALSQEAKNLGTDLPLLDRAVSALKNNRTDLMLQDLETAMHDLEKLQGMARAMQQLQQQMTRLGKDLAEQLEQGQVEAAQNTLERMIRELNNPALTPEQVAAMMQEVQKAVDPAGDYGRVSEFLERAAEQMAGNQRPDASQSLADAAKELARLQKQMQDAQSLMAALKALERAQQAVASGKSWEECQGKGFCQSCGGAGCSACQSLVGRRWGHGGRPGAGVGTWADEGWTYQPQDQQPVDNSGIVRPDMESRGVSERPDDLSENLNPTKVRGQMSPGRSMPSITLKGVHIKGQSSVAFEEAAASAQAEAETALNQDRVPRPYLNTVRDYFDDLKE